jgi:hypothetical protein
MVETTAKEVRILVDGYHTILSKDVPTHNTNNDNTGTM